MLILSLVAQLHPSTLSAYIRPRSSVRYFLGENVENVSVSECSVHSILAPNPALLGPCSDVSLDVYSRQTGNRSADMKQKKFGKKVQNWHRPLGPNELRTRFLRDRNAGELRHRIHFDNYHDWFAFYYLEDVDDSDYQDYWREQLFKQVILPSHHPFEKLEAILAPKIFIQGSIEGSDSTYDGNKWIEFSQRLHSFVQRIQTYKGDDRELVDSIRTALGSNENAQILINNAPHCAKTYCLFAPFWYRSPSTWDPAQGRSLESHLFARYPTPAFLSLKKDCRHVDDKWFCWLILLGRGGSLKVASDIFGWDIAKRFPHFLADVPPSLPPIEGCLYAEVKRLGGNATDYERLVIDPSFVFDITDWEQDDTDVDFWRETASWMIRYRDHLSDRDVELLLAWSRHLYTEAQNDRRSPFQWKGRSLEAALEQSRAYRERCERIDYYLRGSLSWDARGWNWVPEAEVLQGWTVTELTTSAQLNEEGRAMRHCVGGYGWRCERGESAIVSVCYQQQRRVTVEIEPNTGQIIQVRGCYNREPDRDELRVTAAWHASMIASGLLVPTVQTTVGTG